MRTIFLLASLAILLTSCTSVHELTSKDYYPSPIEDQELIYKNGYRWLQSKKENSVCAIAMYYINDELFMNLLVFNDGKQRFTIDYPDIQVFSETSGNKLDYYTDREFIQKKATKVVDTQIKNQITTAYINNEMNKNRLHIANDYIVNSPSDEQSFNDQMDYYSEALFHPATLDYQEYEIGHIYLKEYNQVIRIEVKAGPDKHTLRFELK